MIKKDTFISLMNAVKEQEDLDRKICDAIDVIGGNNNNAFVYTTKLSEYILSDLAKEMDDKWDTISYFVYELGWGKNESGLTILDEERKDITPKSIADLYDYLVMMKGL